jgi:MSHA biogenesis protein MshG
MRCPIKLIVGFAFTFTGLTSGAAGTAKDAFSGRFYAGSGDTEYLQMLDIARLATRRIYPVDNALGVITVFVIPNFAPLFRILGPDIPWATRAVIGASEFVKAHGIELLLGATAAFVLAKRWVATEAGRYRWDRAKLAIPIVGQLLHQAILSRVTRSLAISLDAGLPMIQALTLLARSAGNEYLGERLLRLRDAIERGDSLSRAATAAGIFPPLVLQMISVGEETGELTRLLDEVAGFYQREVDYRLRNLSALIEPLLIVGVGGLVLILALGVFLPLWDMAAKVGHVR